MLKKARKPTPRFKSVAEERAYWETHDSKGVVDWAKAQRVSLPRLRPSTTTISLRLPQPLLDDIRREADRRDVPYQSLMKIWLSDKVDALTRKRRVSSR